MEWEHHNREIWSEEALNLMKKIHLIGHSVRRHVHQASQKEGITRSQRTLIKTIIINGPQRIQDLGALLGLSNSTVSGLVDRLEEKGMVERRRSEEDKRNVYVHVTTMQKTRIYEMHNDFDNRIIAFVDALSKEELETLNTILDKASKAMQFEERQDDE